MSLLLNPAPTAVIQQELVDGIRQFFGNHVKTVGTISGAWTEETLRVLVSTWPAIYVAYIGSKRAAQPNCVTATWALFVTAKTLSGQRADDASALLIKDALIAWLHWRRLPSTAGFFEFVQDANLYTESQSKRGVVVYGLYFEVLQALPCELSAESLDDFGIYYHAIQSDPLFESLNKLPIQGE